MHLYLLFEILHQSLYSLWQGTVLLVYFNNEQCYHNIPCLILDKKNFNVGSLTLNVVGPDIEDFWDLGQGTELLLYHIKR